MILLYALELVVLSHAIYLVFFFFFFSSRRRHTRLQGDWSSDVCSSDLTWNTSQVRPGNYVLTVVAGPVKGQAISSNTRTIGVSVIDGRESLPSDGFAGLVLPSVSAAIIFAIVAGGLTMVLRRKAA